MQSFITFPQERLGVRKLSLCNEAFAAKVNAAGTALLYAGYIGGSGTDRGFDIAVDGAGNAYVTGNTTSDEVTFPVQGGPDITYNGGTNLGDTFVAKVNANGGSGEDSGIGIAVDSGGDIYVTGITTSSSATFPATVGPDLTHNGGSDAFVAKIGSSNSPATNSPFDFDGDGLADISVFRPSDTVWYRLNSMDTSFAAFMWGLSTDKLVPADYDGDGKTDHAIYRDGMWSIFQSSNNQVRNVQFGLAADVLRPGDFDGDGKADIGVFRPVSGTWHFLKSTNGQFGGIQFGAVGDVPMLGDYDGDGKTDFAVFRPSTGVWHVYRSSDNQARADAFGQNGDIPLNGDFNGDGKTDISVYRGNGMWYQLRSSNGQISLTLFGLANDKPVPTAYQP